VSKGNQIAVGSTMSAELMTKQNNRSGSNCLVFGVAGGMIGAMFSFTQARLPDFMELFGVDSPGRLRLLSPTLGCIFWEKCLSASWLGA
jgi:hypothetical protein